MRVAKDLLDGFETEDKSTLTPKAISQKFLKSLLEHMKTQYLRKTIARICKQIYISIARYGSTDKQTLDL